MPRVSTSWGMYLGLGMAIASTFTAWEHNALAQSIAADDTLPENSRVNVEGNITNITGGTRAGDNLFHSFREFSVLNRNEAHFNDVTNIQNIISRVTGSSISTIDGLIKVLGNANLFLLNPNGIVFGPNARLDINGSFVASTANSIRFADGFEFNARAAQSTPLLTMSVPTGLQYGTNPGRIQVSGDGQGVRTTSQLIDTTNALRVPSNQTLALIGGEVSLEGATLKTAGGRIELGSVSGDGFVSLTPINKGFSFGYETAPNLSNIELTQQAIVDASGEGGGDVQVTGRRITLTDGSQIEASTLRSQPGATVALNARELVEVSGTSVDGFNSGLFVEVYSNATGTGGNLTINTPALLVKDGAFVSASTGGAGQGGDLRIQTGTLQVENGSQVRASTFGAGQGGNLTITADTVQVSNSYLLAEARQNATGTGGNLTINTGTLQVQDGGYVSTTTFGAGQGGNLAITADTVQLSNGGLYAQVVNSNATGDGGNLTINTRTLQVQDGGEVSASTNGSGKGGNLTVIATNNVEVTGGVSADGQFSRSGIFAQANSRATAAAGDVTINTPVLLIKDGAIVSARTFGTAPGGNLTVNATNNVEVIGTAANGARATLSTDTVSNSIEATGGNLTINTPVLLVKDGAIVSASTSGAGQGGNLTVNNADLVEVTGTIPDGTSSSRMGANTSGTGNAGNLTINTRRLVINQGQVGTTTFGEGDAGILTVKASEIELSGYFSNGVDEFPGGLFAQVNSEGSGNGGQLNIETGRLSISNSAKVQVATFGQGNAGDLYIRADEIDIFETPQSSYAYFPGGIFAGVRTTRSVPELPTGSGGSATIETRRLTVRDGGTVTTNTQGIGNAGTLRIRATESIEVFGTTLGAEFREANEPVDSEISAAATRDSIGSPGLLSIETGKLIVRDLGRVTVRGEGATTQATGNLEINARSINLDNKGTITATTNSGNGGDILLTVKDIILLRNNSKISATAGNNNTDGDGGNITINIPRGFIVAVPNENSDITANAFRGQGGRISIRATDIFGIAPLSQQELQRLRPSDLNPDNLISNDITAISQQNPSLSGTIEINSPDVDPDQGLVEFPTLLVDASGLVDTSCAAFASSKGSEFIVTGRGGLPPSPHEPLSSDVVWSDTRLPAIAAQQNRLERVAKLSSKPDVVEIIPATGWVFNGKGEVTLISHTSGMNNTQSSALACR
ncbi:MAG: filamentous hemagglutinin N-terminal domain-containing protein [Scytonema sp. PMC 1069.18]|nr:filamentous hemagglutinin N-terminal domain-containing protein [Scytonema sp. PMC 1069.18]MEC4881505.1 filamentous hemagglutinin N-terminal domain-containing protein [Scytonema sp. PMC 1070.18]